jgi:hypothetical protein
MADRFPLTIDQFRQATSDIAQMAEKAEELSRLMSAAYGNSDSRAIRAQEVSGAIQRLQWEIDRGQTLSACFPVTSSP